MASVPPRFLLVTALVLAVGARAHAHNCTSAKLKAIANRESRLLVCQAKVATTGDSSRLSACETKTMEQFAAALARAGTCAGDTTTCESIADGCENTVTSAMTDSLPDACEAAKRRAAGRFAKNELRCYARAALIGVPVDTVTCVPNATRKFLAAVSGAGTCPDGGSPQALVENDCVQAAVAVDGDGMVSEACPATTTTTSTIATTVTTTSTTATVVTTSTSTTTTSIACAPFQPVATGQTSCWDRNGNVISCASTGQDGDLQTGSPLAYTDNGDGTITDDNTGLMWETLTSDGSVHDLNNKYTWADAVAAHVATLNGTSFAGYTDWRLPNVRELESIVDYQNSNPAVSPVFSATKYENGAEYWSSTSHVNAPANAWLVAFADGNLQFDGKAVTHAVRAVRGDSCRLPATGQMTCWDSNGNAIACSGTGQDGDLQKGLSLSYTDNGDGTITDDNTGLMWEKLSRDGSVHDASNKYAWASAFTGHVATLNNGAFAGYTDWRLPNARELHSIANYQNVNPAVSSIFNDNCVPSCTVLTCSCTQAAQATKPWSSTTSASFPPDAWYVGFSGGALSFDSKVFGHEVRAVRGGS